MTNAELIQKIRAEIERRLKDYWKICFNDVKTYNEDSNVRELKELLSFLSTHESEKPVPADLEEAAEKFARLYDQGTCDGIAQDCFIAGAEWHEEQMLKEAVEGYVTLTMTGIPTIAVTIKEEDNIGVGDKVRVIIVKE